MWWILMLTILTKYQPEPKQIQAHTALETEVLFGGAIGGGKSVTLVNDGFNWLERQPGGRGFLGRKVLKHLKVSTLETLKEWIEVDRYRENKMEQCFHLPNGSKMFYGGLDSAKQADFLKSTEFCWIGLDQGEEIDFDTHLMARSRLRQKKPNGEHYRYRMMITANPKQCFLKPRFIDDKTREQDCRFIQALPKDNPHLPETYVGDMRRIYRHRPELLQSLVEGSWMDLLAYNAVIREEWVRQCVNRRQSWPITRKHVSQDVARFGDDENVIFGWDMRRQLQSNIYGKKDLMESAAQGLLMVDEIGANHWTIDEGGLGAGVVDRARQLLVRRSNIIVVGFNGASKAKNPTRFANLRAEAWWEAGERLADGDACLTDDDLMIQDLVTATYHFDAKQRICLDDKEDIKIMLGHSPDRGDACVMGLWASPQVQAPQAPEPSIPGYQEPTSMDTEQSDVLEEKEA